jgi:hypothetical protein
LESSDIPLLSKEGTPRSGRGGYYRRAATTQIFAKRTALKSGGFAAFKGSFATLITTPALTRLPSLKRAIIYLRHHSRQRIVALKEGRPECDAS